MPSILNKNILLFTPNGNGIYGSGISQELVKRGAKVTIYDERPSTSSIIKVILRLAKKLIEPYLLHYYNRIIKQNNGIVFNYVFIIRGEGVSPKIMHRLKIAYPNALFILYLWDSIKNTNTIPIFPFFDRIFSFDILDVKTHPELNLRPLFYLPQYQVISQKKPGSIDVLFIGTVHSDRYSFIKSFDAFFKSKGLTTYYYFYFPSKILYWIKKLIDPAFKKSKVSDFRYKMLTADEASELMMKAKASIDMEDLCQTGLTMRTIEVLGAKRKLITTNKTIKDYDFYDERNILIVDRNKHEIDPEFVKTPFHEINPEIYERYSLKGWIDEIFL